MAVAGLATLLVSPLHAQEAGVLLEETPDYAIFDPETTKPALRGTRTRPTALSETAQPAPGYVPTSPGAVPDAERPTSGSASLFSELETDAADPVPIVTRRPSTARARAEARADRPRQTELRTRQPGEPDAADNAEADAELTTGTVPTPPVDDEDLLPLDPGAPREPAIESLPREPEDDPFAPVGIRAGTFILRPSVEQGVTYTTNANSSVNGRSAVLSETTLRLNALSDWSRHSATLDAYGIFRKSLSGEEVEETEAGIDAALNLDLGEELRGVVTLGYARRPDSASSAVVIPDTVSQPLLQTYSASAGLAKDVGKLRFAITGRLDRSDFGDAELSGGGVLSQEERNATLATVVLRGGYAISPAITPFAEVEIGRRHYDQDIDSAGYNRASDRLGARAGVALDLQEKLSGEVSAGWIREGFEDDRLEDISGATVSANLRWSPERGTTVALAAATTVEGTTTPGESGSILHTGTITLERAIRADLTANASVGGGIRDFASGGTDQLLNAQLGATWWLNRYAGIIGRLRYESLSSDLPGRDYDAASAFLGLKLQR